MTPGISYSQRLFRRNTLNLRLSLQESFSQEEDKLDKAELQSSYTATTTVRTRWFSGVSSNLSHLYTQDLRRGDVLPFAGVTQNRMLARVNLMPVEMLDLSLSTGLELRPFALKYFE